MKFIDLYWYYITYLNVIIIMLSTLGNIKLLYSDDNILCTIELNEST